jgi:hypothetical protein
MNGSVKLSNEEKYELLEDANDILRGKAFDAARLQASKGGLDEYIEFLSQNMEWVKVVATKRITENFLL